MLLAEAGCLFIAVILHISGVLGPANRICALKGSSVELSCTPKVPKSKWYTVHWTGSKFALSKYSADENRTRTNTSEKSKFTLTINDLRENDTDFYCCRNRSSNAEHCWSNRTELHVADLQVKVIPTSEGQTVTLMCTTSCPLTEQPAAYIWYKNSEFLYEDWSPWYQELVSSEAAVRYSCAVKGYEDLRSPEVSVDSITPACFNVTYAKGKMCSYKHMSEDEPCSITYPTEVHVQKTPADDEYYRLTCNTNCPLIDPHTTYRWYIGKHLYKYSEGRHLTVPICCHEIRQYSCAVKGHEYLHTEVCSLDKACGSVNYTSRRICAVEGSSVNISSEYSYSEKLQSNHKVWYKLKTSIEDDAETLMEDAGRLEFHDSMTGHHTLRINELKMNDSAAYEFRLKKCDTRWESCDSPGVTLVVTGLKVTFTPSSVVTEGQRVTLTCNTSCPLTDNTNYIWHLNGRPLTQPEKQNKHLVLDPVSSQHAGNYSCASKTEKDIKSTEVALSVEAREELLSRIFAGRMMLVLTLLISLPLFHLWLRYTHI